jgi:hypothetical protein
MCAQRMLRAGLASDVIASRPVQRIDERQGILDLADPDAPESETAEQIIYRLSYALTALRSQLVRAGLTEEAAPRFHAYSASRGWTYKEDKIAHQAQAFAKQLDRVTSIRANRELADHDAADVNAHIAMIAEKADSLITALIKDAEARGLEATGPWMKIPLVECREFEVPQSDLIADEADFAHDQKLNS